MHFADWMKSEGWSVDYSTLPADIDDRLVGLNNKKRGVKTNLIGDLHQSNFVKFDPTDHPEDFIKIEPFNKAVQLEALPISADTRLPSFERQTIFYGFKFETAGNLEERITAEYKAKIKALKVELKEVTEQLGTANAKDGNLTKAQKDVIDQAHLWLLDKAASPERIAEMLPDMVQNQLRAAGLRTMGGKKILNYIQSKKAETTGSVRALRRQQQSLEAAIKELEQKAEAKGQLTNAIQQAFLKKLKYPLSDTDKQHQKAFIEMAVSNYKRINPSAYYDYIVYPQSGSTLNSLLAQAMASAYGAKAVQGLSKVADPRIDTHNMYGNNTFPKLNDPNPEIRSQERMKINQQIPKRVDGTLNIKNVQWHKIRPFLRNWEMDKEAVRTTGFKGRRLLLIDDNVVSSGTLQANYHVLRKQGPRKVDIYSPLYIKFYY